jgi:hypothetical protein
MRTLFTSLTRPKHLAARLQQLIPALQLGQCKHWTAYVLGYRDWHELADVTKTNSEGPGTDSKEFSKKDLSLYRIGRLISLLENKHSFVIRLLLAWDIDNPRAPRANKLRPSNGPLVRQNSPVEALLIEDLSVEDSPKLCRSELLRSVR